MARNQKFKETNVLPGGFLIDENGATGNSGNWQTDTLGCQKA